MTRGLDLALYYTDDCVKPNDSLLLQPVFQKFKTKFASTAIRKTTKQKNYQAMAAVVSMLVSVQQGGLNPNPGKRYIENLRKTFVYPDLVDMEPPWIVKMHMLDGFGYSHHTMPVVSIYARG